MLIFAVFGVIGWSPSCPSLRGARDGRTAARPMTACASAVVAVCWSPVAGWLLFRIVALGRAAVLRRRGGRRGRGAALSASRRAGARAAVSPRISRTRVRGWRGRCGHNLLALPVALVLLFTGIGTGGGVPGRSMPWLLGRELTDMAWLRHRATHDAATRCRARGAVPARRRDCRADAGALRQPHRPGASARPQERTWSHAPRWDRARRSTPMH